MKRLATTLLFTFSIGLGFSQNWEIYFVSVDADEPICQGDGFTLLISNSNAGDPYNGANYYCQTGGGVEWYVNQECTGIFFEENEPGQGCGLLMTGVGQTTTFYAHLSTTGECLSYEVMLVPHPDAGSTILGD